MAAAVREGGNDRRASERAARKSNRGGEPSSAARKQRSRPPTYKGGAWKLVPKCVEHIHSRHRHFSCCDGYGLPGRIRRDSVHARRRTLPRWSRSNIEAISRRSRAFWTFFADLLFPSLPEPQPGGVFKNAAVHVLRHERRLMSTGEVTKCVRDRVRFLLPNAEMARNA